jgi:hypothetical protein
VQTLTNDATDLSLLGWSLRDRPGPLGREARLMQKTLLAVADVEGGI